jgi:sugar phosphate isomerase/epimerase
MKNDIPLISIGFDGYNLGDTLEGLSKTNSKNISLCAIDGFTKHVIPEDMNQDEWENAKLLFEKYNLNFYGLAGHFNISDDNDLIKMARRMEFISFMNGKYLDTNAGLKGEERNFYKNLNKVIELAEKLDILVCLETHGDLLESGKYAHELFKNIKSSKIKIGYDPANIYFYSRGNLNPAEDIKYIFDDIGIIHFKGVNHNEDKTKWNFPEIKNSSYNFDKFFSVLEDYKYDRMIAIEVEGKFHFEENNGFMIEPIWPKEKIIDIYNGEIKYLKKKLYWMDI